MTIPSLLIVDDNPADVDLLRDVFVELALAARISVAINGQDAIDLLGRVLAGEAERPDAIVLDLNMPRVSGRDVLAHIKGTPALAAIPTIILTSSSSPKDRAECLALGADAYHTKPNRLAGLNELARTIHAHMTRGPEPMRATAARPAAAAPGLIAWLTGMVIAASDRAGAAWVDAVVDPSSRVGTLP
ncbi:MAG TPA: response regulator [Planctomycetota bacterium]|nr:response regulator [Planctomycetota bacterium]